MQLDYLIFDPTDEEDGACSFDAMASVLPVRLAALLAEVQAVLAWAHGMFGAPAGSGDGEWDYELQATSDDGQAWAIAYDAARASVSMPDAPPARLTLALTVTGSRAFADAFRAAFPEAA
jgi:hypothetical protein